MSTPALGHVAMMPQYRDSLFEPPVLFEPPLKNIKKYKGHDLFSPERPMKQRRTCHFVESADFTRIGLDLQFESVLKSLLNRAKRKRSTLKPLKRMAELETEGAITAKEETTMTLQEGIMELKIT